MNQWLNLKQKEFRKRNSASLLTLIYTVATVLVFLITLHILIKTRKGWDNGLPDLTDHE